MELFKYAKWIGTGNPVVTRTTGEKSPALQLRKAFTLEKTGAAQCLISGLGCFVLYINGQRVGDEVLSPAFTDYDKHVLYCTYDVTDLLQQGENVVAVCLGDGFYNQTAHDTWGFYQAPWRDSAKLLLQLNVDGKEVLVSDDSWMQTTNGATVHNCLRTGGTVVVLVQGAREGHRLGLFSGSGHYINIIGYEPDGRFVILDPSHTPGKYDIPERKDKVEIKYNHLVICEEKYVVEELHLTKPPYYLFWRK